MFFVIPFLTCLGAATVGGVFFAFSTFVMKALGQLPAAQGIAAMQRINVVVLGPLFLGVFLGTALLAAGAVGLAMFAWDAARSPWLLASGVTYLIGSFAVTVAFNVPRNERLATLSPDLPQAADAWAIYLRDWTRWNHVRTVASIAAAACSAVALAV